MSQAKALFAVDVDYETEDVIISCSEGDCTTTQRCRVLYGWLLLYLLDPEPFDPLSRNFCKELLATDPPVGLAKIGESVLLNLPDGIVTIPADRQGELKAALAAKLIEFAECFDGLL